MSGKTLRLQIPQWQGGTLEAYHLGAMHPLDSPRQSPPTLHLFLPATTAEKYP